MGACVFIFCVALLVSCYGLKQKTRISNLEMQVSALSWQSKQDMLELRNMIKSMNSTDNAVSGDGMPKCDIGVQAVIDKMEVFVDDQNVRFAALRRAFKVEKLKAVNEKIDAEDRVNELDKKMKASIKELGDRIDLSEFERNVIRVEMKNELQELNAKLEKLEQTVVQSAGKSVTTAKPSGPLEQTTMPVVRPVTTVKPPGPPCPASWKHHGDKCYLFVKEGKTWNEAIQRCHDYDGILAEPDTEEAMSYVLTRGWYGVWLGATDTQTEGTWIWEHSKTPVTYFKWGPRQPDNQGDKQHCMYIFLDYLYDDDCGLRIYFVCQKNANWSQYVSHYLTLK